MGVIIIFRDFRKCYEINNIAFQRFIDNQKHIHLQYNIIITQIIFYCYINIYRYNNSIISDCNSCYIFISQPPVFLKWETENIMEMTFQIVQTQKSAFAFRMNMVFFYCTSRLCKDTAQQSSHCVLSWDIF